MSDKKEIDYAGYIKQINLADIANSQQERLKNYLEEQCKNDDALKAVYNPEKVKDCYEFIFDCVRKASTGSKAYIDDAVVYKMARDYFLEILPEIQIEKCAVPADVSKDMDADAAKDHVKRSECGFEIFGEEDDEPEEAAEEAPCDQEEKEVGKEPEVYEGEGEDEIVQTIVEEDCITVTGRPKTDEEKEAEPIRYDKDGQALLFDFM